MVRIFFNNKKGFMSILEATIAIGLIIGMVFFILQERDLSEEESFKQIYSDELSILRYVQANETLRASILNVTASTYWDNSSFPAITKTGISAKIPSYLECKTKICPINEACSIEGYIEKDVYVQSAFISANATTYSPKEIRLFCWEL